jgi:hypothetical protein
MAGVEAKLQNAAAAATIHRVIPPLFISFSLEVVLAVMTGAR